ncbi:LrgA [Rhodanobacter glycinis]|uniref:LrgA n=1 Tax=Rhodanobacter glycinis TaxID=582702 RepID=A0A502BXC2_9GAMM|nr:LrgA [Rhodanobacter glycinis]TPG05935.1 LrgA [Rhodanobacter glycinis]
MNTPVPVRGKWDKVEFYTSYFLLLVLISFIGTRLGFATVWQLPTIDFVLSVIAVLLVLASFWFGRQSRRWRLWSIAFATATQIVPMVIREPVLLFPLIGALIPIAILAGCLIALSRKGANIRPPQGS